MEAMELSANSLREDLFAALESRLAGMSDLSQKIDDLALRLAAVEATVKESCPNLVSRVESLVARFEEAKGQLTKHVSVDQSTQWTGLPSVLADHRLLEAKQTPEPFVFDGELHFAETEIPCATPSFEQPIRQLDCIDCEQPQPPQMPSSCEVSVEHLGGIEPDIQQHSYASVTKDTCVQHGFRGYLDMFDVFPHQLQAHEIVEFVSRGVPLEPRHSTSSIVFSLLAVVALFIVFAVPSIANFLDSVPVHNARTDMSHKVSSASAGRMPYFWIEMCAAGQAKGQSVTDLHDFYRLDVQQVTRAGGGRPNISKIEFVQGNCTRARMARTDQLPGPFCRAVFFCPVDEWTLVQLAGGPTDFENSFLEISLKFPCLTEDTTCNQTVSNESKSIRRHMFVCWETVSVVFEGDPLDKIRYEGSPTCMRFDITQLTDVTEAVYFRYNNATMNHRYNPYAERRLTWLDFSRDAIQPFDNTLYTDGRKLIVHFALEARQLLHTVAYPTLIHTLVVIGGGWGSAVVSTGVLYVVFQHLFSRHH